MKHIKHYEHTIEDDTTEDVHPQLAKYIICKSDEDKFLCIEIVEIDKIRTEYVRVHTMSFDKNNNIHKSALLTISISALINRIIYKSNNIEDIINNLPIIKTQNKFNL